MRGAIGILTSICTNQERGILLWNWVVVLEDGDLFGEEIIGDVCQHIVAKAHLYRSQYERKQVLVCHHHTCTGWSK